MPLHTYRLYLYVSGQAGQASDPIIRNIRTSLQEITGDEYVLEIVEVIKNPQQAINEGILFTPTLLRAEPEPRKKVVGNFLDINQTLEAIKRIQCAP